MICFFKNNLIKKLNNVKIKLKLGSCYDMDLDKQADLFVVGIYYQGLPTLFAKRGSEIKKCIGDNGILIIQSGMIENNLVTDLLYDENTYLKYWCWYDEKY